MAQSIPDIDRKECRCIIADDSAFARRNLSSVLEKIGVSVVGEASNGLETLSLYGSLHPDLVLLDITMPQLDGVETLRRIIEQDKNARVIIVSSIGHKEMVWKAICLGAKSFVTKPFDPDHAGKIIQDVVSRHGGD